MGLFLVKSSLAIFVSIYLFICVRAENKMNSISGLFIWGNFASGG